MIKDTREETKAKDIFNSIKNKVYELLNNPEKKEVTRDTDYNFSGVYMLYIDDFSDDKILPIYIGQTKDFQKR